MSIEDNKAIVGRWFSEFWGKDFNPAVIDELAAPGIRFEYSLHAPLRDGDAIRAFAGKFRAAFPDLNFWGTADLIAEGDYVVGQWEGGGTHTGDAFDDMPYGPLPAGTGKALRFTGTTVLKVENGRITHGNRPRRRRRRAAHARSHPRGLTSKPRVCRGEAAAPPRHGEEHPVWQAARLGQLPDGGAGDDVVGGDEPPSGPVSPRARTTAAAKTVTSDSETPDSAAGRTASARELVPRWVTASGWVTGTDSAARETGRSRWARPGGRRGGSVTGGPGGDTEVTSWLTETAQARTERTTVPTSSPVTTARPSRSGTPSPGAATAPRSTPSS